jgi:hypothetical protein
MKYSQAVIVACIGGATLASAIPFARPSSDSSLAARGPNDADAATTEGSSTHTHTHTGSGSTHKKWKDMTAEEKAAKKAARKAKNLANGSSKSSASSVASRDFEEDLWARAYDDYEYLSARGPKDTETPATTTPSSESASVEPPTHQHASGSKHPGNGSGHKKWKDMTPEEKAARKAAKKAKKEAGGSSKSSSHASSLSTRDFDEDLWARDFDEYEYLSARGPKDTETPATTTPSSDSTSVEPPTHQHASGSKHPGNGSGHKKWKDMTPEEKAARKAANKAKKASGSSKSSSHASSLSTRDFEEDLWARDFDEYEYLSARGPKDTETPATTTPSSDSTSVEPPTHQHASGSKHPGNGSGHKKWKDMTPEEKAARKAANKAKKASGSFKSSSHASSLSTRDFEDDLAARELLDELYARDVEEYLEARGKFLHALGAIKDTITGKNRAQSVPAADPYAPVARDFLEELDARDFDFEIDELD